LAFDEGIGSWAKAVVEAKKSAARGRRGEVGMGPTYRRERFG
jgi:hypothetical protein